MKDDECGKRCFGTNEHTYLLLPPAGASSASLLLVSMVVTGAEVLVVTAARDEAKEEEEGSGIAGRAKKGLATPLSCSGDRHVGCQEGKGKEEK